MYAVTMVPVLFLFFYENGQPLLKAIAQRITEVTHSKTIYTVNTVIRIYRGGP